MAREQVTDAAAAAPLLEKNEGLSRKLIDLNEDVLAQRMPLGQHGKHGVLIDRLARKRGRAQHIREAEVDHALAHPVLDLVIQSLIELKADAAVQAAKALHGRRQQVARHACERAEADRALFQTAEARRLRLEHPVGVDRVADVRQQVPSLIGERHARARTHQQRHPQLLLQRLDHLAHGRLRVAEIARSVGKAVALKDLQKCDIPVHKHPSRIRNANLTIRIICFTYL